VIFRVSGMGSNELPTSDITLDPSIDEPMYGPPLSAATLPNTEPPPFDSGLPSASDVAAFMTAPAVRTAMPTPTADTAPLFGPPVSLMTLPKAAPSSRTPAAAAGFPWLMVGGVGAIGALVFFASRGRR
jgi:hypothetical protein